MTLTRSQIADVLDALSAARDFLDGQIDVVDGDYGVPAPNRAMTICGQLDESLELMVRAFDAQQKVELQKQFDDSKGGNVPGITEDHRHEMLKQIAALA